MKTQHLNILCIHTVGLMMLALSVATVQSDPDDEYWRSLAIPPASEPEYGVVLDFIEYDGELYSALYTAGYQFEWSYSYRGTNRFDGSRWWDGLPGSPVTAWVEYSGELYAGTTGGVVCWGTYQPAETETNDIVNALTVYDGDLVAAGDFTLVGEDGISRIARWDGTDWLPFGSGIDGSVKDLIVYNGDLIAAGSFATAGGSAAANIARWDGSAWHPLGSGADSAVVALCVFEGQLIAGGHFTAAGGVGADFIAAWDGATWSPLGTGVSGNSHDYYYGGSFVSSLTVFNGELVVGGNFTEAGGDPADFAARWDGADWHGMPGNENWWEGDGYYFGALTVYNSTLIGGLVYESYGVDGGGISGETYYWDGASWQRPLAGLYESNYQPYSAIGTYNNELVIGGSFTLYTGGIPPTVSYSLIRLSTGTGWQGLDPGSDDYERPALRTLGNYAGDMILGGVYNGGIAGWNGTAWYSLGAGVDGTILVQTIYNGELVVAGSFATAGGASADNIARWNGSSWQTFGTGINGDVRALAVQDGNLYAGGDFTEAGGIAAGHVARWDGSSWQPLGSGTSQPVNALAVYDNEMVAGTEAGPAYTDRIVRWSGSNWEELGTGLNGSVLALAEYNGELIAGGAFSYASGVAVHYIASWDGANWEPLGSGTDGHVTDLSVYEGELIVMGSSYVVKWVRATLDTDSDGILDYLDNCPDLANPLQDDADGDDVGDLCDVCNGFDDQADADDDGVPDDCDACEGFNDLADADADTVPDDCDNCVSVHNPDQIDTDLDGVGDLCDGCCQWRVGDANGIGGDEPTIGDVSTIIDALFISGDRGILPCLGEADINQSGGVYPSPDQITIGDVSVLIDYLFITGPSLGLPECL